MNFPFWSDRWAHFRGKLEVLNYFKKDPTGSLTSVSTNYTHFTSLLTILQIIPSVFFRAVSYLSVTDFSSFPYVMKINLQCWNVRQWSLSLCYINMFFAATLLPKYIFSTLVDSRPLWHLELQLRSCTDELKVKRLNHKRRRTFVSCIKKKGLFQNKESKFDVFLNALKK